MGIKEGLEKVEEKLGLKKDEHKEVKKPEVKDEPIEPKPAIVSLNRPASNLPAGQGPWYTQADLAAAAHSARAAIASSFQQKFATAFNAHTHLDEGAVRALVEAAVGQAEGLVPSSVTAGANLVNTVPGGSTGEGAVAPKAKTMVEEAEAQNPDLHKATILHQMGKDQVGGGGDKDQEQDAIKKGDEKKEEEKA